MSDVNMLIITGNVGSDPETRYTTDNKPVCTFSVCSNHIWKDKKTSEWTRCVAFNKTAEIVTKYVKKGSKLYVRGRKRTENYTDKDGNSRQATSCVVDEVQFLSAPANTADNAPAHRDDVGGGDIPDDDIPF